MAASVSLISHASNKKRITKYIIPNNERSICTQNDNGRSGKIDQLQMQSSPLPANQPSPHETASVNSFSRSSNSLVPVLSVPRRKPMKSCLVTRWISIKGYNDPCTNPPHSLQSQDDFVFLGRLEQLPKPARLFCSHTALAPLGEWPASIHFHFTQRNPNVATSTHQKPREILTPP